MPLIVMLAYVSDMTYAGKVKKDLEASLDAAALAAVINQNLNESERAEFAKIHFNENFGYSDMFDLEVINSSPKLVELTAKGGFPSYIGSMTGRDKFGIQSHATSVLTTEDVICMLALDPSGEGAFTVSRGARFYGKDCSVQVNSTHASGAIVDNRSKATAKSFCVSGGADGSFSPFANSECARVEDPFADVNPPIVDPVADCTGPGKLILSNSSSLLNITPNGVAVLDNAILFPGIYCNPVSFEGTNITLMPGDYIFQDTVEFFNGTQVAGDGVTLILNGPNSTIELMGGADLKIKAPANGPYAGLAIFQNRHTAAAGKGKDTASGTSEVWNGSGMNITGTVYLPTQRIYIGRDSNTNVTNEYVAVAPATSFIAHQIHLDSSVTSVAVDHKTAGLPAMLPRSDEGARLIR